MNPSQWNLFLIVMLTLISIGIQLPSKKSTGQNDQRQRRHVSKQSFNTQPYWEHILREFVFNTISPSPPGNHHLYKRLLDAPFYGGPFPIASNDTTNVVLSRGDVYYLPDGHWLFCQQGCIDCEVCTEYTHPTMKWVLRRIKRVSAHGSTRHDLQLTIVPQIDGSYHMRSLWPRSYVYVTSQAEQDAYLNDKYSYRNDGGAYLNVENDVAGQKRNSGIVWTYVDKNSLPERRDGGNLSNDSIASKVPEGNTTKENIEKTSVTPRKNDTEEQMNDSKDAKKQRPGVKLVEKYDTNGSSVDIRLKENGNTRVRPLVPKLILGTDPSGQKHLVHVVPADASTNANLMNSAASGILNSPASNRTAYQRILRRIFDSLNSNRKSIEHFLEPVKHADGKTSEENEEHLQQETRSVYPGFRQAGRLSPMYNKENQNDSSLQKRWPHTFDWAGPRRNFNGNQFVDRFINNTIHMVRNSNNSYASGLKIRNGITNLTLHSDIQNKNLLRDLRSKLIENNHYGNKTFGNSLRNKNITLNRQDDKFSTRKYKIVISTDLTTESGEIMYRNEKVGNHSYPIFANQNGTLTNRNSMYDNVRNATQ